jgi:hypothetical protein
MSTSPSGCTCSVCGGWIEHGTVHMCLGGTIHTCADGQGSDVFYPNISPPAPLASPLIPPLPMHPVGWICPVCGTARAPWVAECKHTKPEEP